MACRSLKMQKASSTCGAQASASAAQRAPPSTPRRRRRHSSAAASNRADRSPGSAARRRSSYTASAAASSPRARRNRARCHQQCAATAVPRCQCCRFAFIQRAPAAGRSVISKTCAIAWCARVALVQRQRGMRALLGLRIVPAFGQREGVHRAHAVPARQLARPAGSTRSMRARCRLGLAAEMVDTAGDRQREHVARPGLERAAQQRRSAFVVVGQHAADGGEVQALVSPAGSAAAASSQGRAIHAAHIAAAGQQPGLQHMRHRERRRIDERRVEQRIGAAAPRETPPARVRSAPAPPAWRRTAAGRASVSRVMDLSARRARRDVEVHAEQVAGSKRAFSACSRAWFEP